MRASRFLALSFVVAATVATAGVTQAQPRRPRPAPAPAAAPSAAAAEPIPPAAQAPGDIAPNAPTLLSRESEIRRGLGFQAFIDGQLGIPSKTYVGDRGFSLNDAAIYISKDFGSGLAAMIDLPFASAGSTTDNGIQFGENKAQAFFQYNRGALNAKIGQFDTIFGAEQNDSKDRFFADAGIVKSQVIPVTHTGLLLGTGFEKFVIRGLIADPQGASSQTNTNLEFGVQGRFDVAPVYVSVGVLFNQAKVANDRSNVLIDVMGGFRAEQFRIDAFYNNLATAGSSDSANSFGAIGTFNMKPDLDLGARLEYAKDLAINGVATDSVLGLSVGPNWKFLPEVTLRGDATLQTVEFAGAGAGDTTIYGLNLSIVATL